MKISIDTSSFSFRFIGILFVLLSLVIFLFFYEIGGFFILLISTLLITQKYKYLIPKKSIRVEPQVEKTLKLLNIDYKIVKNELHTKTTKIKIVNCGLFTVLQFKFDTMYNIQGRYLMNVIVKYQRYN